VGEASYVGKIEELMGKVCGKRRCWELRTAGDIFRFSGGWELKNRSNMVR
jgi:hypothetical protein